MSDSSARWWNDIHEGDAVETLAEMPESSVHCVMTSPPYYGLRDYGIEGQIGLEESLSAYIDMLVEVGDALKRVLRDDGSWWLNLGDSFASRPGWGDQSDGVGGHDADAGEREQSYQRKQKMLVPHRVAIALQDAGWVVRSDCVWAKSNPMPHSVKDRFNEHKEFIFHLTPQPDYWFDLDAVREPHKDASIARNARDDTTRGGPDATGLAEQTGIGDDGLHPNGKNPGDIFEVPVNAFPDAHFAVYPPELCEAPLKATAPPEVCAVCGTPYERVSETIPMWERDRSTIERPQTRRALELADEQGLTAAHFEAARSVGLGNLDGGEGNPYERVDNETAALARETAEALGSYYREALMSESEATDEWTQACDCPTVGDYTTPGIVLDPFAGAGTTCLVAKQLGRRFAGIELNPEYVAMAQKRIGVTVDEPERLLDEHETILTAFTDGGARQ